jgi:hypothetical protein
VGLDILRLRLRPGVLQSRASSSIVVGIVADAANGDGSHQTTTNSAVQRRPGMCSRPAAISRQAAALALGRATGGGHRGDGRGGQSRNGYQPGLHGGVEVESKRLEMACTTKGEVRLPIASLNRSSGGEAAAQLEVLWNI